MSREDRRGKGCKVIGISKRIEKSDIIGIRVKEIILTCNEWLVGC